MQSLLRTLLVLLGKWYIAALFVGSKKKKKLWNTLAPDRAFPCALFKLVFDLIFFYVFLLSLHALNLLHRSLQRSACIHIVHNICCGHFKTYTVYTDSVNSLSTASA